MATLIILVGPIASGKSTIASALGSRCRAAGKSAAVLDLDDVVGTIGGFAGLRPTTFRQAQTVFGQTVGAWLNQGFDVIAHGPFFASHEIEAVLHAVPETTAVHRVLLLSNFAVALQRVADDPNRKVSSDPDFLRRTYERVETLLPTMAPSDWTFDTTTTAWETIVDSLIEELPAVP